METRLMTHASLFSGIGGAEIAAAWAGWKNVFHCDINMFGCEVLRFWFPDSEEYHDITKTDFTKWRGRVDVLTAGFPCQPFSVAGKRRGGEDKRYLWPEAFRALREIRPTWFVGENVSGIISMVLPGKRTEMAEGGNLFGESHIDREVQRYVLDRICDDIESAGYEVQPLIIPACAVGAPHRRDRVWILARRKDGGLPKDTNSDGCKPNFPEGESDTGFKRMSIARVERRLRQAVAENSGSKRDIQKFGGWEGFPSERPFLGGDDGIPERLAGLSIPVESWNRKALESLGNAWVPEVAYEIFRLINIIEKQEHGNT